MQAIVVNDESREVAVGTTVADLLAALKLQAEHVAVERNREIVRREAFAATTLHADDILQIVTFVGGG